MDEWLIEVTTVEQLLWRYMPQWCAYWVQH